MRRYPLTSPYPTSDNHKVLPPPAKDVRYTSTDGVSGERWAPRRKAVPGGVAVRPSNTAGWADAAGALSAATSADTVAAEARSRRGFIAAFLLAVAWRSPEPR